ncbi:hypothetical protein [Streptomyces sp.]
MTALLIDDPELDTCPDCEGDGHFNVVSRGVAMQITCGTCHGDGVITA